MDVNAFAIANSNASAKWSLFNGPQRPEPQENAASKIREDEWLGLGGSNRLILSGCPVMQSK